MCGNEKMTLKQKNHRIQVHRGVLNRSLHYMCNPISYVTDHAGQKAAILGCHIYWSEEFSQNACTTGQQ